MPFTQDVLFGRKYELVLLDYLPKSEYTEVDFAPQRRFPDWDVRLRNGALEAKYEVKADKLTAKTGNFCIEYECAGQPSGISTTKADWYAYFVVSGNTHDLYLIPVERLKQYIETSIPKRMNGGDGYRSRFYLIPKDVFSDCLTPRLVQP